MNQPGQAGLIAGPCSAESFNQVMDTAKAIAGYFPNAVFRAGVWKPRTRPGSFEGLGEKALPWLSEVKAETGLRIAIEVATPKHVELALKHNIDLVWIGARTVVNPFSVQELANALQGVDIPVMIKNPIHPDVQLWMGAIERILNAGIVRVAAIHRGFHTHAKSRFRNEPCWEIPIELKTMMPELALFCDPSHIAGKRSLLPFVSQRAMDLAMDGLMIETHCKPDAALSDAKQQITPDTLYQLINDLVVCRPENELDNSNNELKALRKQVDRIDEELVKLLAERLGFSEKIGAYKKEHNISILQLRRWKQTLKMQLKNAAELNIDENFIKLLYQLIHDESIKVQSELKNKKVVDKAVKSKD